MSKVCGGFYPWQGVSIQDNGFRVGDLARLSTEPDALTFALGWAGVGGEENIVGGGKQLCLFDHQLQGTRGRSQKQDVICIDCYTHKCIATENSSCRVTG